MRVARVKGAGKVRHPYVRRILTNLEGKDAHRIFASGPAELRKAIRGLSAAQMRRRPAPGKWPISYLVHHICDTEVGLGFRIRLALSASGVRFQAFDQDQWAAGLHYDRRSVAASVALYSSLRASHLELLRFASARDLKKFGVHEERGKETVERVIHLLAGHDLNHLRQIRAIRAGITRR